MNKCEDRCLVNLLRFVHDKCFECNIKLMQEKRQLQSQEHRGVPPILILPVKCMELLEDLEMEKVNMK